MRGSPGERRGVAFLRPPGFAARLWMALWALALTLPVAMAEGQGLPLKRALAPETGPAECVAAPSRPAVPTGTVAVVDSLLAAGSAAAILGDHYTAGELLREAAGLDPGNPVIAYRLARTYEERGEAELALAEYCRYMRIAPESADAGVVRERVRYLASTTSAADQEELAAMVRAGLQAYDQGRYEAAALAFTRVVELRPRWPAAHYNRALAYLAARRPADAITGLDGYLALLPTAEDAPAVIAYRDSIRMAAARRPRAAPAPDGVLLRGLLLPGLGQLATRRPVAGVLVLGGVAGAVYYGLRSELVARTISASDPFGNPYEYEVRAWERPHLAQGLGITAAVALTGAVEAYFYARRDPAAGLPPIRTVHAPTPPRPRLHLSAAPTAAGAEVAFRLTLSGR